MSSGTYTVVHIVHMHRRIHNSNASCLPHTHRPMYPMLEGTNLGDVLDSVAARGLFLTDGKHSIRPHTTAQDKHTSPLTCLLPSSVWGFVPGSGPGTTHNSYTSVQHSPLPPCGLLINSSWHFHAQATLATFVLTCGSSSLLHLQR